MSINSVAIAALDSAIWAYPIRPKGIKVGTALCEALQQAGRLKMKHEYIVGIRDSGIISPVLDENIFVIVDRELDEWGYVLP
jgi:hypothetical protein